MRAAPRTRGLPDRRHSPIATRTTSTARRASDPLASNSGASSASAAKIDSPMTTAASDDPWQPPRGVAIETQPAPSPQDRAEDHRADPAGHRDRRRHADVAVAGKQSERSDDRGRKPGQRSEHRRARVLVRERHRAEYLLERVAGQAGADRRERRGDGCGVARPEGAALEQRRGDRLRQHGEADRGRKRQAERNLEAARLRAAIAASVAAAHARGDRRHQHRGHGDRDRRRAAIRRGGWRSRATTPPPARTTRPWRRRSASVAECRQR